jgi:hypothetical protein
MQHAPTELAAAGEVLDERVAHGLEAPAHGAVDEELLRGCHVFTLSPD